MNNNTFLPLTDEQLKLLTELSQTLSHEQINWVSGYFIGLLSQQNKGAAVAKQPTKTFTYQAPESSKPKAKALPLTILYGSRTGNGESIALQAQKNASALGFDVKLKSMENYKNNDLKNETNLLLIVSTHGEGEPPFQAKGLYDFIFSKRAQRLENVNFSVLALGDSSYLKFCQTGIELDERLEELGAKRFFSRVDCDVNFRVPAFQWLSDVLNVLKNGDTAPSNATNTHVLVAELDANGAFDKTNPFEAQVLEKNFLHGNGSPRQTLHVELSLENSGLTYEPGDSLGVFATNPPELVDNIIKSLHFEATDLVTFGNESKTLHEVLFRNYELTQITPDVLKRYQKIINNDKLAEILSSADLLKEFVYGKDLLDLFDTFPQKLTVEQFISILRPIQPRLYSIASSQKAYPDEVHLAVGVVKFNTNNRDKTGLCSVFLSDRTNEEESAPVFVEKNNNFRLPKNSETPIIMVGAGTGIAPYRAFVQHRELDVKRGKSWLIFGNRNSESEFLYQLEWQRYLREGSLTHMDVAFSRDSKERVYVQNRIQENGKLLYQWLQEGAHFYVCGDMKKMARDVHSTLVEVVSLYGGLSHEAAEEYLVELQHQRRYQTDVY